MLGSYWDCLRIGVHPLPYLIADTRLSANAARLRENLDKMVNVASIAILSQARTVPTRLACLDLAILLVRNR
jgi:hypothetical protein